MRSQVGFKSSVALRLSTVCALALSVSACSSDTMRFTEAPFSNPFRTAQAPAMRDPATTGSIGRSASAPMSSPAPSVGAVRAQPLPPPQSAVALRSVAPAPVAGSANGWSAQGGTAIVVAQGETLDTLSSRYGVPRSALMSANGLSSANVAPGSRLTIPVYNAGGGAAPQQVAQVASPQSDARTESPRFVAGPAPAAAQRAPVVPARVAAAPVDARAKAQAAAETKAQAAAEAKAKTAADAQAMRDARAKFAAEAKVKAEAKAKTKPVVEAKAPTPAPVATPTKTKPVVVASAPAEEKVSAVPKSAPEPTPDPKTTASLPKEEDASKADFRWPARGRVIAGYGGKGSNEGINIAVPEGTPIKAAEGGVVAYAGSELKGYGNLVLIRHPNGYVSAYAHNGELNVKRGESVKRGQVVAKSGQSGNVSSPQLHFELRKGSSPVDPVPYLNN
ncbi:Peptidase M23 [Bosea sp. LC85]|uniref:LysM peptidoglycan-binding domain-containing M23 family metallopeptidase n=1 Tax=Bosea sp. LC85 TaxID=1502851 RepID=UPI0004E45369|nr:LysM peptidoglycan-binding domain-containing M23 family metallopeptidase [Bosea sp. LC85]KFC74367.1 Peptidase M23 [Bosea sp. LC85]